MTAVNFPNSPSNGDTHTVGTTTYTYNSTKGYWDATPTGSSINLASVGQHVIPDTDNTYDLGSTSNKWRSLYVDAGTIHIGSQTIKATSSGIELPELTIGTGTTKVKLGVAADGSLDQTATVSGTEQAATKSVALTDISVTTASAGASDLAYNNSTGAFTYTPPDLSGYATTSSVTALVDSAPGSLDTLNELAAALGDDANFSTAVTTSLAGKSALPVVTVTVAGGLFLLDGTAQQIASLAKSTTYRFDQSDATNASHPLRFSTTSDGTHGSGVAYTTGVTEVGTPGSTGAYTQIVVEQDTPSTLYYYCGNHSGMGGQVIVGSSVSSGGSGGSIDLIANGSIAEGKAVVLDSTGTVSEVAVSGVSAGAQYVIDSNYSNSSSPSSVAYDPNSEYTLVFQQESGQNLTAKTEKYNSVSQGFTGGGSSVAVVASGSFSAALAKAAIWSETLSKFVLIYTKSSTSAMYWRSCSINATNGNLTLDTEQTMYASGAGVGITCDVYIDGTYIFFVDSNARVTAGTISVSGITWGTASNEYWDAQTAFGGSNYASSPQLFKANGEYVLGAGGSGQDSVTFCMFQVTSNTVTIKGVKQEFTGGGIVTLKGLAWVPGSNRFVYLYYKEYRPGSTTYHMNVFRSVSFSDTLVWGTPSAETSFVSGRNSGPHSVITGGFSESSTHLLAIGHSSTYSSWTRQARLYNLQSDGTVSTAISPVTTLSDYSFNLQQQAQSMKGYLHGGGPEGHGMFAFSYYFNGSHWLSIVGVKGASTSTNTSWVGINTDAVADGETATITLPGGVNSKQSGMTEGATYFVQQDGTITTSTTSADQAGVALSETQLLVADNTANSPSLSSYVSTASLSGYATTSSVTSGLATKAPLASPDLTGVPTAPTASSGTNTTQIATTEFVTAATAASGGFEAVADGAIAAGKAVTLESDGKVKQVVVAGRSVSLTSSTGTSSTGTPASDMIGSTILVNYGSEFYVGIASTSGVSWGTGQSHPTGAGGVLLLSETRVLAYSNTVFAVGTISGTSVTFGATTTNTVSAGAGYNTSITRRMLNTASGDEGAVFIRLNANNGVNFAYINCGTSGNTAPTVGATATQNNVGNHTDDVSAVYHEHRDRLLYTFWRNVNNATYENYFDYGTLTVDSSNVISFGPVNSVANDSGSYPSKEAAFVYDNTNNQVYRVRGTSTGMFLGPVVVSSNGTITFGSTTTLDTASHHYRFDVIQAFDQTNEQIATIFYANPGSGDRIELIYTTVTNSGATLTQSTYSSTTDDVGTVMGFPSASWWMFDSRNVLVAGTTGRFYLVSRQWTTNTQNIFILKSVSSTTKGTWFGINTTDVNDGGTATITLPFNIHTTTGLTVGNTYYVQDNGDISATASTKVAGRALSTTKLLLKDNFIP